MSPRPSRRRWRAVAGGAAAAVLAALAPQVAMTVSARADTAGNPVQTTATVFSQANVVPTGPLTGLRNGNTVAIHVLANYAGHPSGDAIYGVDARLCSGTSNVSNSGDMSPTVSGNCLATPFNGSSDNFVSVATAPPNSSADLSFRVGTGTETFNDSLNVSHTITCDQNNPCRLWLKESVPTSLVSSGAAFVHYDLTFAGQPGAPVATSAAPGDSQATVNWTAPTNTGNAPITSYVVTYTDGSTTRTQNAAGNATSAVVSGLTNFTAYTFSIQAVNTAADGTPGASAASNTVQATPGPAGPTNVTGTPADRKVNLSWTAPANTTNLTGYQVEATPTNPAGPATAWQDTGSTGTAYSFTGLTNGTVYTFRVRAVYGGTNFGSPSAPSAGITPQGFFVTQHINVTRPQGNLVLTQVCGGNTAPYYTGTNTSPVYPNARVGQAAAGAPDLKFSQYPYPVDANGVPNPNYPTDCSVDLGIARLVTRDSTVNGARRGQYFEATGAINQVTVVDTRDTDPGWTANGQVTNFTDSTGTKTISGNDLGWSPRVSDQSLPFTDGGGRTYAQRVTAGARIIPPASGTTLSAGSVLASAPSTSGLGIARLDASLDMLIPVFARSGDYTSTLTLTAV